MKGCSSCLRISNKKVKWFICPFYLSKGLQYIFTKVSYFMLDENTCDFLNATFVVDSATPWKGTSSILLTVGSSCMCSVGACSYRNEWEFSHWCWQEGWSDKHKASALGVVSGVGPFDAKHLALPLWRSYSIKYLATRTVSSGCRMMTKSTFLLSGRTFEMAGTERLLLETLKDRGCKNLQEGKTTHSWWLDYLHHVNT